MGRLTSFLTGAFVGATIMVLAMKFHYVHADDGFHVVPKLTSSMSDTYADIRDYGISDWNEHRLLLAALVKAEKSHVVKDKNLDAIGKKFTNALDELRDIAG